MSARTKSIRIDLLPEDFKRYKYTSNTNCPLAKAIKRYLGISKGVEVGSAIDPSIKIKGKIVYR